MKESSITTKYIAKPRLKELLSERDDIETYQQFADMVGVKKSTISRFDKQGRYDINTLISIIKVLDCTVDELFDIEFNEDYVMRETEKAANMAINEENLEHFAKIILQNKFNITKEQMDKYWDELENNKNYYSDNLKAFDDFFKKVYKMNSNDVFYKPSDNSDKVAENDILFTEEDVAEINKDINDKKKSKNGSNNDN